MVSVFDGSIGFTYDREDHLIHEDMNWVLSGISKILQHQLYPKLKGWTTFDDKYISIEFNNLKNSDFDNVNSMCFHEIKIQEPKKSADGGITKHQLGIEINLDQFLDLEAAMIDVDEGVPFALPIYDIHQLEPYRIKEVRDLVLDYYYAGLEHIGSVIDADFDVLKKAFDKTRAESWYVEKEIGEVVLSRGKNPSKAQLIARWEPDYIYHYARVFKEDGTSEDLLFMVYWRMIGGAFFEDPGRLSWMNSNTLKFIPNRSDDYRIAFKVDKGPIDFSHYYDPPRRRATKFYSHLSEAAQEEGTNTIRMNF